MILVSQDSEMALPKNAQPPGLAPGFGRLFTDHMLVARYDPVSGWQDALLQPYGPLSLDPATMALHYGQTVFEGVKAFRGDDGRVRIFRPQKYIARLTNSATRLCIPPPDEERVLEWLVTLVRMEEEQVPSGPGSALYLRAFIFASDPYMGVRPSASYVFCIIASPVGAYFDNSTALRILVEDRYVRAVQGGMGAAKTSGNYAAGLLATEKAHAAGYSQVLWLDAIEHRHLEEVGTMNIILRFLDEVVTPPLGGTILDGVTRDSVLVLLDHWGVQVSERPISIDEVLRALQDGSLCEMWGTGTAAGIAPVGVIGYKGQDYVINGGLPGEMTNRLELALSDLQYARVPDELGWLVEV